MKLIIWAVVGTFEGGRATLSLFLDENWAEIRRAEWDEHEDCLETQVHGFETQVSALDGEVITMNPKDRELKPIK